MSALRACWKAVTIHWKDYIYNLEAKKKQLDVLWQVSLGTLGRWKKEKLFKIEIASSTAAAY